MPLNTKTISYQLAAAVTTGIATAQTGTAGTSLTINGALASGGVATLDSGGAARRVLLTFAASEATNSFLITGTDRYGRAQTEQLAGGASTSQSVKDFLTVSSIVPTNNGAGNISAGTNGVGSSEPYICDWTPESNLIGAALVFNGTANATVQEAMNDLAPAWNVNTTTPDWFDDTNLASKSANAHGQLSGPFTMIRLTINSGTTLVKLQLIVPSGPSRL